MTEPTEDLLTLATPYALHAMTEHELAEIDRRVAASPADVAAAFADEVRAVRETMALVASATATEPPDHLRQRLLASLGDAPVVDMQARRKADKPRWRMATIAAAAAVALGLGGLGIGLSLRPATTISAQDPVFSATDVRTVTGDIPTGGTATVVFSRERNAGWLVMNNVAPPQPGTVYQMWLLSDAGARSAGTMNTAQVAPSTTAQLKDLGNSKALAFTVEQGTGSLQPTLPIIAQLPLI